MSRKFSFKKALAIFAGAFAAVVLLTLVLLKIFMPSVDSSSFWITRAIEESYFYDKPQVRAALLTDVANAQVELGDHDGALQTVVSMRTVKFSLITQAKRKAQQLLAKVGIGKGPQQVANNLNFGLMPNYEAKAYAAIAASQANAGSFAEAIDTAEKIHSANAACAQAFADITAAQARAGDLAGASATLKILSSSDSYSAMVKADAMETIAAEHARRGDVTAAVNVLESFGKEIPFYGKMLQPKGYAAVTAALADSGRFELAEEYAATIQQADARAQAQSSLASAYAHKGRFEKAREIAEKIRQRKARMQLLGQIVEIMANQGRQSEALALAEDSDGAYQQGYLRSKISLSLAQQGKAAEAERLAQQLTDPGYKKDCLLAAADAYLKAGNTEPVEAIAGQLVGSDRVALLLAVARSLADARKASLAAASEQKIRSCMAEAEKVAQRYRTPEIWLQIARASAYMGDLQAAEAISQEVFQQKTPASEAKDDSETAFTFGSAMPQSINYDRLKYLKDIAREFAAGGNNMDRLDAFWHDLNTPADRLHCAIGAAQGLVAKEKKRKEGKSQE